VRGGGSFWLFGFIGNTRREAENTLKRQHSQAPAAALFSSPLLEKHANLNGAAAAGGGRFDNDEGGSNRKRRIRERKREELRKRLQRLHWKEPSVRLLEAHRQDQWELA
jgi:hypothetical protein